MPWFEFTRLKLAGGCDLGEACDRDDFGSPTSLHYHLHKKYIHRPNEYVKADHHDALGDRLHLAFLRGGGSSTSTFHEAA